MFGLPPLQSCWSGGIILAVWYGFKLIARLDAQRRSRKKRARAAAHSPPCPKLKR